MGNNNRYNNNNHYLVNNRNAFLPMLCSKPSSLKDVHVPIPSRRRLQNVSPPSQPSFDPFSPRVGCMGQVKRNHNRVIMVFPTTATAAPRSTSHGGGSNIKYSKLKRLFSGNYRNVLPASSTPCRNATCGRKIKIITDEGSRDLCSVDVAELDPPLPVIRKVRMPSSDGGDGDSLWKRRSAGRGGGALKTLQIQQISVPTTQCLQSTTSV